MSLLSVVLLVWASIHVYVWLHVWLYASLGLRGALALGAVVALLMACPVAGIGLQRSGIARTGQALWSVGMVWAGLLWLFFWLAVLQDVFNVLLALLGLAVPGALRARLLGPYPVAICAGVAVVLAAYSMLEARRPVVRRVRVPTEKLRGEPLRIVQLSDLHLGRYMGKRALWQVVKLVQAQHPDVVVSTGDLWDGGPSGREELAGLLARIEAPLGKFGVPGNHEFYAGLESATEFARLARLRLLSNELVQPTAGLSIVGVSDPAARRWGLEPSAREAELVRQAPRSDFVLLLKHRPLVEHESVGLIDLQLSGHTHGGQIFPASLLLPFFYRYGGGLTRLAEEGGHIYVSRGTGWWGPPMRLLTPPEITVIELVPESAQSAG